MTEIIADKNYFLDKEGNVTTDSTKASDWLAREGALIPKHVAERYGIPNAAKPEPKEAEQKVAPQPDAETEEPAEKPQKSVKPSANKAVKPAKNK